METIPNDFIEQVLLRTAVLKTDGIRPPAYVPRPQFASLQGHWGQFGKVLARETQPYHMTFNVMSLPHFDCRTFLKQQMVPIEAIIRKKHTHLLHLTVTKCPIVLPQDQLILDEDIKKLQRLFHRSTGISTLCLKYLPSSPEMVSLLKAIPRVSQMTVSPAMVEDIPMVTALVERHVQLQHLRSLEFKDSVVSRDFFPMVRTFLTQSSFECFHGGFADRDLVEEIAELLAVNLSMRIRGPNSKCMSLKANMAVLNELKKTMGHLEEQWPGRLQLEHVRDAPYPYVIEVRFLKVSFCI